MAIKSLEINSKEIHLMKSVTSADYSGKTVLTNSSWEYVELWLKRQSSEKSKRALFYWSQAKNFYIASENLPMPYEQPDHRKVHLPCGKSVRGTGCPRIPQGDSGEIPADNKAHPRQRGCGRYHEWPLQRAVAL